MPRICSLCLVWLRASFTLNFLWTNWFAGHNVKTTNDMEPTIKEMIERLLNEKGMIDNEIVRIDRIFQAIGADIGRAKEKSNNVSAAIAMLVKENSQNPTASRLGQDAYKRITDLLEKPVSF